jgi:hypothetical protein
MQLSFEGRIRNIHLPYTRALMPLFEAIINSIHAIEDSTARPGKIVIEIKRDTGGSDTLSTIRASGNIVGFTIEDNGTGFTNDNYNSFETSDSVFKLSRGAKGVGRFMWLKAFTSVQISSVFQNGKSYHRTFGFDITHQGIHGHQMKECESQATFTRVELNGFHPRYTEECPKRTDTIADHIVEHCLFYLLDEKCPAIELNDATLGDRIVVNDHFRTIVRDAIVTTEIKIGHDDFKLKHIHLYSTDSAFHEIHLCGDRRDVFQSRLNNRIPELRQKIKDADGNLFTYYIYVSSTALDQAVNTERTGFTIPLEGDIGLNGELTIDGILNKVEQEARLHLAAPIGEIQAGVKRRVSNLIATAYPEHRQLLKYVDAYSAEFAPSMKDDDIALKLNEIQFKEDIKTREEAKAIVEKGPTNDEVYKKQLDHYLSRMSEFRESRLAQYVIHRKCILEILRKRLEIQANDKYSKEEQIHEVIFPVRESSDDIEWKKQNLWLLDEGLAYHHYLASDKPFCAIHADSTSKDRADLVVYNNPSVFSDSDNEVLSHITIIEFKRPERDTYGTLRDQPVEQIYRYIREIRDHKVKTSTGRTIKVHPGSQFHCYVICDITPELLTYLEDHNFAATPDQEAFYFYAEKHKAYVEVISFNRLLTASESRNRVLFRSLGLLSS